MRFATTSFFVAVVLFAGGATSVLGSWAMAAACVLFLIAAVAGAVAMEERDQVSVEGLVNEPPAPAETDTAFLDVA